MIQEHPPGIFLFLWKVLEFLSYHIFQRMALIMLAHKCPFVALKGWSLNNVIIHAVVSNGAAICQPTAQSSIRTMEEDMIFRFIILLAKAASGRRNLMPRASFLEPIQRSEAGVDNFPEKNLTLFGQGNLHNCLKRSFMDEVVPKAMCDINDLTIKKPLLSKFQSKCPPSVWEWDELI